MNSRQFLAVILIFVLLVGYMLYASKRKKEKEKYEYILNERLRLAVSNIQLAGEFEIKKMEMKGKPRGFTWEEMAKVDSIWLLEKNGNVDERTKEVIPSWLIKKYKKQLNADY